MLRFSFMGLLPRRLFGGTADLGSSFPRVAAAQTPCTEGHGPRLRSPVRSWKPTIYFGQRPSGGQRRCLNMKLLARWAGIVAALGSAAGAAHAIDYRTYDNPQLGLSLSIPAEWET